MRSWLGTVRRWWRPPARSSGGWRRIRVASRCFGRRGRRSRCGRHRGPLAWDRRVGELCGGDGLCTGARDNEHRVSPGGRSNIFGRDAPRSRSHSSGFVSADDPRMTATVRAVRERLEDRGLLYRYVENDGPPAARVSSCRAPSGWSKCWPCAGRCGGGFETENAHVQRVQVTANDPDPPTDDGFVALDGACPRRVSLAGSSVQRGRLHRYLDSCQYGFQICMDGRIRRSTAP